MLSIFITLSLFSCQDTTTKESTDQVEDLDTTETDTSEPQDDNEDSDGDESCDESDPNAPTVSQDPECDGFYTSSNGVTILCPDIPVRSVGVVDSNTYTKRDLSSLQTASFLIHPF